MTFPCRTGEGLDEPRLADRSRQPEHPLQLARALATSLGDLDAALGMLGPVLERDPGGNIDSAKTDPDIAGLRDDPRFQKMLAEAQARVGAKPG